MRNTFSDQLNPNVNILTVSDIVNNKYDVIHQQMYDRALYAFIKSITGEDSIDDYIDSHILKEIKSSYYDKPSKVIVIEKAEPSNRQQYDLSSYWGTSPYDNNENNIPSEILIDDEFTNNTLEVVSRDYVRNIAKLKSRLTGKEITMKLSEVPDNIPDMEYENSIRNTFIYKVENKIYGNF